MKKENAMLLKQGISIDFACRRTLYKSSHTGSLVQPGIAAAAINDAGKRKE